MHHRIWKNHFLACGEFGEQRLLDVWLIFEAELAGRIILFLVSVLDTGCLLLSRSGHYPPVVPNSRHEKLPTVSIIGSTLAHIFFGPCGCDGSDTD